jgi:uncharacterized protein (DUF2141 family)
LLFDSLPGASLAVGVLHDKNSNGQMDYSLFGLPREGFGVSHNVPARTGPPRFTDAVFILTGPRQAITITMQYR